MNKSKLPVIAKAILKKLNSSETKDLELNILGDRYEVIEYNGVSKFPNNGIRTPFCMGFNYSNSPLPTQEELEKHLYNSLIRVRR